MPLTLMAFRTDTVSDDEREIIRTFFHFLKASDDCADVYERLD